MRCWDDWGRWDYDKEVFWRNLPKTYFDGRFQTIPNSQLQQQPKYIRIVSSGNALATNSTPIKVANISLIIPFALLQHLTIPMLMLVLQHSEGVVDVVGVDLAFDQVLHTVPQQHLTTLVASPQHHAPATLSTGTRTIKVYNFSVFTDLKSSLIVTFLAQTVHNICSLKIQKSPNPSGLQTTSLQPSTIQVLS